jgi:hypothetical protein
MKTWVKIFLGLAFTGIIALVGVYMFVYNKPHPDYEKANAEFSLTAHELFYTCRENPESTGIKYNGEVVEVSGTLDDIELAGSLVIAVFTFEEGMFGNEGVRVTMLQNHCGPLREHNLQQPIKLKGFCAGYNGTDVILEKGSIVY